MRWALCELGNVGIGGTHAMSNAACWYLQTLEQSVFRSQDARIAQEIRNAVGFNPRNKRVLGRAPRNWTFLLYSGISIRWREDITNRTLKCSLKIHEISRKVDLFSWPMIEWLRIFIKSLTCGCGPTSVGNTRTRSRKNSSKNGTFGGKSKKNQLSLVPFRIMHIFAALFLGTKIRRLWTA